MLKRLFTSRKLFLLFSSAIFLVVLFLNIVLLNFYGQKMAYEAINSWIESEKISIQYGNILTSIAKGQRIFISSNILVGVSVLDEEKKSTVPLATFGHPFPLKEFPPVKKNKLSFNQVGVFKSYATYFFPINGGLVIKFDINPKYAWIMLLFISGFMLFILIIFFITVSIYKNSEKTKSEMVLYTAINELINEKSISKELQSFAPNLINKWTGLQNKIKKLKEKKINVAVLQEKERIYRQVAHDIRSPIAAMNSVMREIDLLPEQTRIILRAASQRIQDIANNLLLSNKLKESGVDYDKNKSVHLLSSAIEEVISEKRISMRDHLNIEISLNFLSYGLFAEVSITEFKSMLSNLLNNSLEALASKEGRIVISLKDVQDNIVITIEDNGRGISEDVLKRIGEQGGSYGKENDPKSGFGLGLSHAKRNIDLWNGAFAIKSLSGKGTEVTITLPKAIPPGWFVCELLLKKDFAIVCIDDDISIHQIWEHRFLEFPLEQLNIELFHLANPGGLSHWIEENAASYQGVVYLCDMNFIGHSLSGLDLITQHNIEKQSILVTSYYEDEQIKMRCEEAGVRLIPKMMADIVPIKIID